MVFALFSTIACGPADPADQCREGTTLAEDGHCYPPLLSVPPDIHDAIDALPECDPTTGPGVLDLGRGCANEGCVDDRFETLVEALGDEVECVTRSSNDRELVCTWEELGIDTRLTDDDEDGVPDLDARASRIHVAPPYHGQTPDGAGIGANVSCFFDTLGLPNELFYTDNGGTLLIERMDYDAYGLQVFDDGTDDESGIPNGFVDNMILFGI